MQFFWSVRKCLLRCTYIRGLKIDGISMVDGPPTGVSVRRVGGYWVAQHCVHVFRLSVESQWLRSHPKHNSVWVMSVCALCSPAQGWQLLFSVGPWTFWWFSFYLVLWFIWIQGQWLFFLSQKHSSRDFKRLPQQPNSFAKMLWTCLTHCGLVMPYCNFDLGQHWLM